MSIKLKLHLIVLIGICALTLNNMVGQYLEFRNSLEYTKQRISHNLRQMFTDRMQDEFNSIRFSLISLMRDPHIIERFAARDREGLTQELTPYYRKLRDDFGIAQFQFHLPPALSFLRFHRLDKFGDDLSEFRRTVVMANENHQLVQGLEVGRGDLGMRVVMPLVDNQEKPIGSVEFGGSALRMVEPLKSIFGTEYAIGVEQDVFRASKRFESGDQDVKVGNTIFYAFSSTQARQLMLQYQPTQDEYVLDNVLYTTTPIALKDFSGKPIGYVLAMSNLQQIRDDQWSALLQNLTITSGIALVVFLVLSWVVSHTISRPLRHAQKVTSALSQGKLGVVIQTNSQDEIGKLLNAIDATVIQQFQSVVRESGMVLRLMADGKFNARITGLFLGDFATVKNSVNEMAEKLQSLIQANSETLGRLAQGDLSARIQREFPGDFKAIKDAVNHTADNLQILMQETNQVFGQLSQGHMQARIHGEFPGDFAAIKIASNALAEGFEGVICDTGKALAQLASGELDDFWIAGEFPGDFKQIRSAMETTANKLYQATHHNQIENWLKTGQSHLAASASGEQNLAELAEKILNFLCEYLEAQVGAFYVLQEEGSRDEPQIFLKMIASRAYTWRKNSSHRFNLGEGLVGQAALERKTFVIRSAPADYLIIGSGLGEAGPTSIVVFPFLFNQAVKGVIEMAAFTPFSEQHLLFLEQVAPSIGIAINTAQSRTRMQALLGQTRAQAEELKVRETELTQINEELKSQTEELQMQQEELRQTNEQLEERSRDLERQKSEIGQQNQMLEKNKRELQEKARQLETISQYKSEFLANMSHELRTPLNSLLILAQLLADNKEHNLTEKQQEYASTIHKAGKDLLVLINDILDLAKVEAGKLTIQYKEVMLKEVMSTLESRFRPMAEQKGLQFVITFDPHLPPTILTDEQRFTQIITNLLSNAFKFTAQGRVEVALQRPPADFKIAGLEPQNALAIHIIDTGIGIPADKQQVVFEAFQQADGTTSRRYGGTGLGLSISRQLTQLLGGVIQLRSEPGQGCQFSVYLPEHANFTMPDKHETQISLFSPSHKPATTVDKPIPPLTDDRDTLQAGARSILIVEDDHHFASILRDVAHEKGYQCLIAENGSLGLELTYQYQPSAIILDVGLPLVDGWTVMERLKNNPATRHIPVHFVSGSDYSAEARRMGAIGYSMKPVSMGELSHAFKQIDQFLTKDMKHLLIVTDNADNEQLIRKQAENSATQCTLLRTLEDTANAISNSNIDCMVLDVNVGGNHGISWLQTLCRDHPMDRLPVILYAKRGLTTQEEQQLLACEGKVIWKQARSNERLLDEVTLFLHQVESKLPEEQQQLLRKIHDKEALLKGKNILLVDDDMRNVFSIGSMLEEKGIHTLTASDGQEGLAKQNVSKPVLMIIWQNR